MPKCRASAHVPSREGSANQSRQDFGYNPENIGAVMLTQARADRGGMFLGMLQRPAEIRGLFETLQVPEVGPLN